MRVTPTATLIVHHLSGTGELPMSRSAKTPKTTPRALKTLAPAAQQVKCGRDAASGQATGKRSHGPVRFR